MPQNPPPPSPAQNNILLPGHYKDRFYTLKAITVRSQGSVECQNSLGGKRWRPQALDNYKELPGSFLGNSSKTLNGYWLWSQVDWPEPVPRINGKTWPGPESLHATSPCPSWRKSGPPSSLVCSLLLGAPRCSPAKVANRRLSQYSLRLVAK